MSTRDAPHPRFDLVAFDFDCLSARAAHKVVVVFIEFAHPVHVPFGRGHGVDESLFGQGLKSPVDGSESNVATGSGDLLVKILGSSERAGAL
jgi:hypothetical protein